MSKWGIWINFNLATTKELQVILKSAKNKIERLDFEHRLGTDNYDASQLVQFRAQCKNVKLRHIYYRLISRDFYTKQRMLRLGMSRDDECMRCGNVETYRHLMYD